jgi:hypothetical protein
MAVNSSPSPNDSVRIVYYRTNSFLVDGWGTLKTPLGTFTTLRMKKIASNLDTTYNHPVGGNWIRGQVNGLKYDTSYSWLANGLFEVASMSKYSPGIYRYSFYNNRPATTGLSNAEQSTTHFSVYPNPVSDVLNLDYQGNKVSLSITNAMGQDCGLNTNTHSIDVSGLNPGIYLIHIQSEDGKHLIQKFIKM